LKTPPFSHMLWLSRHSLGPYNRVFIRVRGEKDQLLVQSFQEPITMALPPANNLVALVTPKVYTVASGTVLHLTSSSWRHDRPLRVVIGPGVGSRSLLAIHRPEMKSHHPNKLTVNGKMDGANNDSITVSSIFDPKSLDIFVIPTSARRHKLTDHPLSVTVRLDLEAFVGKLFQENWFDGFTFAMALLLFAEIGVVLFKWSLLFSLVVDLAVALIAVLALCTTLPNPPFTAEQGLFLCIAGTSYVALSYIVTFIPSMVLSGIVALIRLIVPFKDSTRLFIILLGLFTVAQSVILAMFGPLLSLACSFAAVILLIAISVSGRAWDCYRRLMPIASAILFAVLFTSGSLLDEAQIPLTQLFSTSLFGPASYAVAAILLAARGPRPLQDPLRIIQVIAFFAGGVCIIYFGMHKVFISVAIALFTLIIS